MFSRQIDEWTSTEEEADVRYENNFQLHLNFDYEEFTFHLHKKKQTLHLEIN